MPLRYFSVCSGIEAPTVAWESLGWTPVGLAEIDKHPNTVLAHHYPTVPNYGDINYIDPRALRGKVDLLVGGTPCQNLSIQGDRTGLSGERSGLFLRFVELLAGIRPKWFIWENVPGALSCSGGQDFATILGCLSGRRVSPPVRTTRNDRVVRQPWRNAGILPGIPEAYGLAWRVLDAQYFGVPQMRDRVFIVGHLGDWQPSARVLFEREGDHWHLAPKQAPRSDRPALSDQPLVAFRGKKDLDSVQFDLSPTITAMGHLTTWANSGRNIAIANDDVARWLTPVEVERCMGFPDNYTAMIPGGARYKSCGNSIAVPVVRWLGKRINEWEFTHGTA
jgi:DNA (cytosine-5)-methyltransferase 1